MASKSAAAGRSQQHGQSSREGKMRRSAIPCCLGLQKTILVGLRASCVQLFLQSAFQGSSGPRGSLAMPWRPLWGCRWARFICLAPGYSEESTLVWKTVPSHYCKPCCIITVQGRETKHLPFSWPFPCSKLMWTKSLCFEPLKDTVFQFLSCVWLFTSQWTAACQASWLLIISRSLPKLISIESIMPSNRLILCHPLLQPSIFPSIRVFSSESAVRIRWPKCWSFSFSISPSNEYSGLI